MLNFWYIVHGPSQDLNPNDNSTLDYLLLLWPASLSFSRPTRGFFVTNVFPGRMDAPVARLQPEGVPRYQSVPLLLPAYNKCMGGVDRTDQLRRTYGFDRKSKHY